MKNDGLDQWRPFHSATPGDRIEWMTKAEYDQSKQTMKDQDKYEFTDKNGLKWQDATSYSRGQEREPNAFACILPGNLRIVIMSKHRHYPGEWVFICHAMGFADPRPMGVGVTVREQAALVAVAHVRNYVATVCESLKMELSPLDDITKSSSNPEYSPKHDDPDHTEYKDHIGPLEYYMEKTAFLRERNTELESIVLKLTTDIAK